MKCPKCQFENPEGIKFCGECGAKLERLCPSCNLSSPPNFKFCGECGHKLDVPVETSAKDLSFDEKLNKIQKYLPKGLTEKILSQRDRIEGERKQVTVLFCDMEGFTPMSELLGIEEAYSVMDQVYEILIHKVHDYEGTVNEMTGDGILALFGAPIALEDAPQRAIRSSLAIHREMAKFSDKLKQEKKDASPAKMRIGIHTGPVVVGTVGNDLRVEFKAVGDTVNLASRVEGLAVPGATYVTEETFSLTEGLFRFEAIGQKQIKGKERPVNVYRVIAPSTRRTRFDVSAERGLTTFVGRERELELLIEGFERSKSGRGQAFSIVSEAGIGKSRLLYEFRKAVINEDVTFLEGKCLSYSKGVAYHPVIDILKANFDIGKTDGDSEITEKVKRGLTVLDTDEPSTLPYLLELLSVKESGMDKILMSPEARKDRIIESINRIALKGSEIRPLIMAFEDLHWIDKSSEESLKYLLDCITGARVFLILTYRPEFVHTWGGKSYHSQVNLNRLSNRESLAMVSYFLETEDIDKDLAALILEKTEGVPLFLEEFVNSLIKLKIIKKKDNKYHIPKDIQEVAIPSTIQDVIMARVDSLPEGAKELLQTGSVIEREFSHELIKGVMGLPEEVLLSNLSLLRDSELLYERGIYPQSTYIFKHALTREVVYNSILAKKRKGLHEKIGLFIEDIFRENIAEHWGLLAKHFLQAQNYQKAAEYSRSEAKKAQKAGSYLDAIEHANVSIRCLEQLQKSDSVKRKIIDARAVLAGYYLSLGRFFEAKEAVDPIFNLAIELNYEKKLPQLYTTIGAYKFWVDEEFLEAVGFFKKAMRISEEIQNLASLWFSSYFLGITVSGLCEFEKGLEYFRKALDLSLKGKNPISISFTKGAMTAFNYHYQGKIDEAYRSGKESLNLAEQSGDIYVKGMAFTSYGIPCYLKGLLEEAQDRLIKGLDFCRKSSLIIWGAWAGFWLGELLVEKGEYEKAVKYYEQGISFLLEHGEIFPSWTRMFKVCIARSKVLNNDQDINLSNLLEYYSPNKMKLLEGFMARYIGEIQLNLDAPPVSDAENWITIAIEADRRNSARWLLGCDYALYAELFKRKGDKPKAKENLNKAIDIFKECGADGWVQKYEKEFTALQ